MPSSTPAASGAYTRRAVTRSTPTGSARRSPAIHSANVTQTRAMPTSPRLPPRFVQRIDSATHLRRTSPPHRSGRRDLVGAGPADLRLRPRLSARVPDAGGVGPDRSARRDVGSWGMSAASAEQVTVQSRMPERGPDQCFEDEGQGQRHLALLAGTTPSATRPTTASCKGSSITVNNRWLLDIGQLIARPARRW